MNYSQISAIVKLINSTVDSRGKYHIECKFKDSSLVHQISYYSSQSLHLDHNKRYVVLGRMATKNGVIEVDASHLCEASETTNPFIFATLIGRVGKDPTLRSVAIGNTHKDVADLSLAVNHPFTKVTSWYNCTAWGKTATNLAEFVKKGHPVLLSGNLAFSTYTANNEQRESVKLTISEFQLFPKSNVTLSDESKTVSVPDIPF